MEYMLSYGKPSGKSALFLDYLALTAFGLWLTALCALRAFWAMKWSRVHCFCKFLFSNLLKYTTTLKCLCQYFLVVNATTVILKMKFLIRIFTILIVIKKTPMIFKYNVPFTNKIWVIDFCISLFKNSILDAFIVRFLILTCCVTKEFNLLVLFYGLIDSILGTLALIDLEGY